MAGKEPQERATPSIPDPAQSVQIGTIEFSAERDLIVPAMMAVQKALSVVAHDKTGEVKKGGVLQYSYRYTSLPALLEALVPLMHENGLLLVQGAGGSEVMGVTTCAMHTSGQWAQTTVPMVTSGAGQAVGSGVSFGRRYGALALFGLVTEDDDGRAATASVTADPPIVNDDMLLHLPENHQAALAILHWKAAKIRAFLAKFVSKGVLDEAKSLAALNRAIDQENQEAGR